MGEAILRKPVSVFPLVDGEGRPIGQVLQPTSAPILGCGAGTVLLVRDQLLRDGSSSRACA